VAGWAEIGSDEICLRQLIGLMKFGLMKFGLMKFGRCSSV
jgi:hypothetical protein